MSAQEIIAELPKLQSEEFRLVREKIHELESTVRQPKTGWGKAPLEIAGTADDLPADLSANHNHYLAAPARALAERGYITVDALIARVLAVPPAVEDER